MGRYAIVIAASLALSACARSKPSGAETSPAATSPVPKPKSPAPQPPPHRRGNADILRAVMAAQTTPRLTGFVTARRQGSTVVDSFGSDPTRVSWQGTCIERIEEAFPGPNQEIPPECLQDAEIVEQTLPPDLEDMRADHLFANPATLRRWRSCRQRVPAETCLDRLLPLEGGGSVGVPGLAGWIKERDAERRGSGALRRKTCHLALVDPEAGMLAFRCRGTLVDALCSSRGTADQDEDPVMCSGHEMVEVAKLGPAPSDACLTSARVALRAPPDLFANARSAALAVCTGFSPKVIDDRSLGDANRLFVQRLLARQEVLEGPLTLPPRCTDDMRKCVEVEEGHGDLGRVIAQGCGNQIWAIEKAGTIDVSRPTGDWGGVWDDRRLVRLPAAAKVREPTYTVAVGLRAAPATFYIVNSANDGNEFNHHYQLDAPEGGATHPEAELIEEDCVSHQGSEPLCEAYAWGSRSVGNMGAPDADRARVQGLLGRGWPRAFRRLQSWQRKLADGARLASYFGEKHREICARLLIDACTGDLGEVCTSSPEGSDGGPCDGDLLPDGRCRRYRFARIPLLTAQPPAR